MIRLVATVVLVAAMCAACSDTTPPPAAAAGSSGTGCGECDDGNPCTSDACVDGECVNPAYADEIPCSDDGKVCRSGTCQ